MLDGLIPANPQKPHYTPFGMAREIFYCKAIEAMFSGPAGTGKTRSGLELMDLRARKYPGSRHLLVRKTRTSLTQTALVTLNEEVLNGNFGVDFHSSHQDFTYPNGSKIVVGGLDNATKIMSGQYDTIYVVEAVEALEDDWEKLMTRLRNGKMPYAQLYGDCNPDKPTHWIVQRANAGRLKLRNASHKDNPRLWDEKQQCLTVEGERYVTQILGSLTGVRRARLLEGRWVAAEGIVYNLDYDKHLLDNFNRFHGLPEPDEVIPAVRIPPKDWKFYLSIDFGFTNPFVAQFWAEDPDGRLYLFLEIYHSQRLVEDHAVTIKKICEEFDLNPHRFEAIICDHDAEGRATLEKHLGVKTTAAKKAVKEGVEAAQSRYKIQADGKPRIYIQRDTVYELDQNLKDRKLPMGTIDEIGGYIWDPKKDAPVKENDHGCLIAGTLVDTITGSKPIETITEDDFVLTRNGYKKVEAAGLTSINAKVATVHFSDGRVLTGTLNHPVFVEGKGFIPIDALRYSDVVIINQNSRLWKSSCYLQSQTRLRECGSMELFTAVIRKLTAGLTETISDVESVTKNEASEHCTETFGSFTTAKSQKVFTSTTKTETRSTTILKIWKRLSRVNIMSGIFRRLNSDAQSAISRARNIFLKKHEEKQLIGIVQEKDANGIDNKQSKAIRIANRLKRLVKIAVQNIKREVFVHQTAFVQTNAKQLGVINQEKITSPRNVLIAIKNFLSTNLCRKNIVQEPVQTKPERNSCYVVSVVIESEMQPVFNLTVSEAPEYFANGVLVHNCDAKRYMVAHLDLRKNNKLSAPVGGLQANMWSTG